MKKLFSLNRVAVLLGACSLLYACTDSSVEPAAEASSLATHKITIEQADALSQQRSLQGTGAAGARTSTENLLLDFSGSVTAGPSKGTVLAGQLNLTVSYEEGSNPPYRIFNGALVLPDSTKLPARGVLIATGEVYLFVEVGRNRIVGQGIRQANGTISGSFVGPVLPNDRGLWTASPVGSPRPTPIDSVKTGV